MNRKPLLFVVLLVVAATWPADSRSEAEKTASAGASGSETLRRMAQRLAPADAEPVRSVTSTSTLALDVGGESMTMNQEVSFILPDKFRQVMKTPMGDQVVVINGDEGVAFGGGHRIPIPQDHVREGLKDLALDLLVLASHTESPELEAVAAGPHEVDGTSCELVSVSFRGAECGLCVDDEGTVVFQRYQGEHPFQGTPGVIEVRFFDYKEVDGRLAPHRREIHFEGEALAKETLESLKINADLNLELFEIPAKD